MRLRRLLVLVAMAGLVTGPAMADDVPIMVRPVGSEPSPPNPDNVLGKWTYPSADESVAYYPAAAVAAEVEGRVKVNCFIGADGWLTRCDILSEDPQGYGFGDATVAVFVKYTHIDPASVYGGIKPGYRREFTYQWALD